MDMLLRSGFVPQRYLLLAFWLAACDNIARQKICFLDKVAMKYPKEKVDMLLIQSR